jgi:hypothetical protein
MHQAIWKRELGMPSLRILLSDNTDMSIVVLQIRGLLEPLDSVIFPLQWELENTLRVYIRAH